MNFCKKCGEGFAYTGKNKYLKQFEKEFHKKHEHKKAVRK